MSIDSTIDFVLRMTESSSEPSTSTAPSLPSPPKPAVRGVNTSQRTFARTTRQSKLAGLAGANSSRTCGKLLKHDVAETENKDVDPFVDPSTMNRAELLLFTKQLQSQLLNGGTQLKEIARKKASLEMSQRSLRQVNAALRENTARIERKRAQIGVSLPRPPPSSAEEIATRRADERLLRALLHRVRNERYALQTNNNALTKQFAALCKPSAPPTEKAVAKAVRADTKLIQRLLKQMREDKRLLKAEVDEQTNRSKRQLQILEAINADVNRIYNKLGRTPERKAS